ncbi:hypothetical protein EVJ24_00760 [Exiguobacterium sp. SH1S21]|uniref:Ig-like domain-containing protein n=1 Tax=Exiguobacterium sp. SH1S21 TaxID=2510953 RepID=UPI00103B55E6|nr:Ig-like domain-containing protein [Exiguobacterium sp. SH1S21]TCI57340.1 hypothetical protein EVJ24_00760 [Exiguobacterium sp. SH1S21]
MAKKSFKLVKASAALAVAAAALTPVMAAEASTSTVELKAEVVLGGKFKEALALNTPKGVEIKWGKYLVTAINKWQTVKGQGSDGKTYIKKLYPRNYPLYVLDQDLGEVEAGSELEKPSIRVMYRDGKIYTQAPERFTMSSTYNTKDEGEQKVLISYNHNGNRITSFLTYTVVAGEVEFEKVSASVDQAENKLSVMADVKNAKADTKADLVIYPFKDASKAVTVPATIKDGKLTAEAAGLPAGDHSFVLKSGEVVSEAVNFSVEAPMVKAINQLNGTQVEVKFNKAVDKSTLLESNGDFKAGVFTMRAIDSQVQGTFKGVLSADGMTLTVTSTQQLEKRYDVVIDKVKTVKGDEVEKYAKIVSLAKDMTAPTIAGVEQTVSTKATVKFSERMTAFAGITYKYADGSAVAAGAVTGSIAQGADYAELTLDASKLTANKEIVATFIGARDLAGNLITPNPATASFRLGVKDGVKPVVSSVVQTGASEFTIQFSEALQAAPAVSATNTSVSSVTKVDNDASKYVVKTTSVLEGVKTVSVSSYTDLSGEAGDNFSRVYTFVKDVVEPKVVSSVVVVDATDKKEYLELTFDKNVVLTNATVEANGTYVKDFVTKSIDGSATGLAYKNADNKKVVRVALASLLSGANEKGASYNVDLVLAGVASESGVAQTAAKASFVRSEDGTPVNETKVAVVGASSFTQKAGDNSTVLVTFDKEVDGASATNISNYRIDGAVISSVTLLPVAGGQQVAELKLAAGSNAFTGDRNVAVEGVKAKGSTVAMDRFTAVANLKENVAPTVTSAKLVDTNKVRITFSEVVTDAAALDFEVLVGGKAQATAEIVNSGVGASAVSTVDVTIATVNADKLSKGLSLKLVDTLDIVDAAGNKVVSPATITITN